MLDTKRFLIYLSKLIVISLLCAFSFYQIATMFHISGFNVKDCITFAITVITLSFTFAQYLDKKESNRINLLLSYNERFMSDVTIQKVITYLQYFDENRDKPSFDPNSIEAPSQVEFTFFARFFEELQTIITSNNINKQYACRLFGYYAVEAYNNHKEKIGDVESDNSWYLYRTFCIDMIKVENKLKISHD